MDSIDRLVRRPFGKMMLTEGIISEKQYEFATAEQAKSGESFEDILVKNGFTTEKDVATFLCTRFNRPYINPKLYDIDVDLLNLVPPQLLLQYRFVVLDRFGDVLTLCITTPPSETVINSLREQTGCKLDVYVGLMSEVDALLRKHLPDYYDHATGAPVFDATVGTQIDQSLFDLGTDGKEIDFSRAVEDALDTALFGEEEEEEAAKEEVAAAAPVKTKAGGEDAFTAAVEDAFDDIFGASAPAPDPGTDSEEERVTAAVEDAFDDLFGGDSEPAPKPKPKPEPEPEPAAARTGAAEKAQKREASRQQVQAEASAELERMDSGEDVDWEALFEEAEGEVIGGGE